MTDTEKKICELTLEEGNIISVQEFHCDGVDVEQFIVEADGGEEYHITKHDDEFVYFYHAIK